MFKHDHTLLHRSFAMALAAAIAVTAAGCSGGAHTSSAPSDVPQAATVTAAIPVPTDASTVAETSAAADTSAAASAETDNAAASATAAASETADASAAAAENAATDSTAAETAAAESMEDGLPGRDTADTALKESVLSEALVECTGWGQSAGSSLRAATAAVLLLQWANEADAANADPALLADTVKAEVNRLSDSQKENLKANWSTISFDASLLLDSYDEISPILEDAGCAEAAKSITSNKNSLANWEALEHALDAALK